MIDLSRYKLAFEDNFDSLKLFNGTTGTWDTTYYWGARTLGGNGERQLYVDPTYNNLGLNPFSVSDGVLTITAQPASASLKPQIENLDYTSGLITSEQSFSMQYGYFEMRAQLPAGQGLWPAFWMLGIDGQWPEELDIVEVLGNDPSKVYTHVHTNETGSHTSRGTGVTTANTSQGFHTFGVDWGPSTITFYVDGQKIYETATPADMHNPMYMLANLAVGGYWPGNPDGSTPFPAEMKIDYIRAYQRPSDHAAVGVPTDWAAIDPATAFSKLDGTNATQSGNWENTMSAGQSKIQLSGEWARYVTGNDLDNFIGGSDAQYNYLDGAKGNDVYDGNFGIDVFVVRNGEGNDTIVDFSNTVGNQDKIELHGFHFRHFDDVKPWLTQVGADTMLRLDQDQAVLFKNTAIADLKPEQFVFLDTVSAPANAPPAGSTPTAPPTGGTTTPSTGGGTTTPPPTDTGTTTPPSTDTGTTTPGTGGTTAPSTGGGTTTPPSTDTGTTTPPSTETGTTAPSTGGTTTPSTGGGTTTPPSTDTGTTTPTTPTAPAAPTATAPGETLTGTRGSNTLTGTMWNDVLQGLGGNDRLDGGAGNDWLVGGRGKDTMFGGLGDDVFMFLNLRDSLRGSSSRDVISDWGVGTDQINLERIDANTRESGDQAFTWIGQQAFSGAAGELHQLFNSVNTLIEGDVNGDRVADFQIELVRKFVLSASDFTL